jgi:hypothetical protein
MNKDELITLIKQLRDLSYDTGWLAGSAEHGGSPDHDYQIRTIDKRNFVLKQIINIINEEQTNNV